MLERHYYADFTQAGAMGGDLLSNISIRVSSSPNFINHLVSEECIYDDVTRPSASNWTLQCTTVQSGRYVSIQKVGEATIRELCLCEVNIYGIPGNLPIRRKKERKVGYNIVVNG